MRLVDALAANGIELIGEGALQPRSGRGGVDSNEHPQGGDRHPARSGDADDDLRALWRGVLLSATYRGRSGGTAREQCIYGACLVVALVLCVVGRHSLLGRTSFVRDIAARSAVARRAFPHRRARGLLLWSWSISAARPRACSRSAMAATKQAPQRVLPFYPAYPRRHEPGRAALTTPSAFWSPGNSCRCRPGRW